MLQVKYEIVCLLAVGKHYIYDQKLEIENKNGWSTVI